MESLVSLDNFVAVSPAEEDSIWKRNYNANPETGVTIIATENDKYRNILRSAGGVLTYPTGTVFDSLIDKAVYEANEMDLLSTSTEKNRYVGVIATLYRYDSGQGLVWHNDDAYLGAFSYYIGPEYDEDDGGYFVYQDSNVSEPSDASVIFPRPNRMVVFTPSVRHLSALLGSMQNVLGFHSQDFL